MIFPVVLGQIEMRGLEENHLFFALQNIQSTNFNSFLKSISANYPYLVERLRPKEWEEKHGLRAEFPKEEVSYDQREHALKTKFKFELPERLLETWNGIQEVKPVIKIETHLRLKSGLIEIYLPINYWYNIIIDRIGHVLSYYLTGDPLKFRRVKFEEAHLDGWINWRMFKELRSARFKEVQKGNLRNVYFNGVQLTEDPDYKAYRKNRFGRLHAISFLAEISPEKIMAVSINGDKGKITVYSDDPTNIEYIIHRAEELLT